MLTPRTPWNGRRVVLAIGGGIAAYKTAQLARDLTQLGARVARSTDVTRSSGSAM